MSKPTPAQRKTLEAMRDGAKIMRRWYRDGSSTTELTRPRAKVHDGTFWALYERDWITAHDSPFDFARYAITDPAYYAITNKGREALL